MILLNAIKMKKMKVTTLTTIEPGVISSVFLDERQTLYVAFDGENRIITTNLKRASEFCRLNYKAVFAGVKKYGFFKSKTTSACVDRVESELSTLFDYEIE